MTKITSLPFYITDNQVSEDREGLCPILSGGVPTSASLIGVNTGVASEYEIREAINNYMDNAVSGINLGTGAGLFKDYIYDQVNKTGDVNIKKIDSTSSRFTVSTVGNSIIINYDGTPGECTINNYFVQGGSNQLFQGFTDTSGFEYISGNETSRILSGYSTTSIPICANMQNTSLSADTYLSGIALGVWNKDIAIGKIGIQIPINYAFPISNQIINIGISGDPTKYGYFYTKTSGEISSEGEWQPLNYTSGMYSDQYDYYTTPNSIYAWTTGINIEKGSGNLSGEFLGQFGVRVFYDQVNYGKINDQTIIIDSAVNNQTNPITVAISNDGYIQTRLLSGEYNNIYGNDTLYNVSGNYMYYGDINNNIKFNVKAGDNIYFYITSGYVDNTGNIAVKYTLEEF